ncbi:unnamed protein product [Meganyctiphanes norvegica]|uniref:Uncharacterized protein n=1 Tax=Meganyctiphanes norvegica TaxID=48144 RepID=A0AAV2PX39_MEGNR
MDAIIAKASILGNIGDLDEALELLESAIQQDSAIAQDSKNIKAKSYYCQVAEEKAQEYLNKGNKEEALKFYEKILQVDSENIKVQKAIFQLRKKTSSNSVEVICLSSDEDGEDIKEEESPSDISRSASREQSDLSDDDQEDNQTDNCFGTRVLQFLQNIKGPESFDLSVNQMNNNIDTNENGSQRSTSGIKREEREERVSDKYQQDFRFINNDVISEEKEINNKKIESGNRNDYELKKTILSESNKTIDSEILSVSAVENTSVTLSEKCTKYGTEETSGTNFTQTIVDSNEKESTNSKITDRNENENIMKKNSKKRILPKLTRLPSRNIMESNSLCVMKPQNTQEMNKLEGYSIKNRSQSEIRNQSQSEINQSQSEINQSQSEMSNEKVIRNSRIVNNFDHSRIIENDQYSRNGSGDFELATTEDERENSHENDKILNKTRKSKSEDKESQYFKETNEHKVHKTPVINRKVKNCNRENNEKEKDEETAKYKSSGRVKQKNNNNKEDSKEKGRNNEPFDKSEKNTSKSKRNFVIIAKNVKQSVADQKFTNKKASKHSYQKPNDNMETKSNYVKENLFGVNRNSLNTMELEDFDLPDIETSMSSTSLSSTSMSGSHREHAETQKKVKVKRVIDEEYDELNELRKDLEQISSTEDVKDRKETPTKNRKSINLDNVKSKKTCEFLERLRKENEKTEKRKIEMSDR